MTATRRDVMKRRIPTPPEIDLPPSVPGIVPALVDHLLEVYGEGKGLLQFSPGPGFSISECALVAAAHQAGRDEVLNYLVHLAESNR
jgi:hypothetical protein